MSTLPPNNGIVSNDHTVIVNPPVPGLSPVGISEAGFEISSRSAPTGVKNPSAEMDSFEEEYEGLEVNDFTIAP